MHTMTKKNYAQNCWTCCENPDPIIIRISIIIMILIIKILISVIFIILFRFIIVITTVFVDHNYLSTPFVFLPLFFPLSSLDIPLMFL